jgi:hypothetical protein
MQGLRGYAWSTWYVVSQPSQAVAFCPACPHQDTVKIVDREPPRLLREVPWQEAFAVAGLDFYDGMRLATVMSVDCTTLMAPEDRMLNGSSEVGTEEFAFCLGPHAQGAVLTPPLTCACFPISVHSPCCVLLTCRQDTLSAQLACPACAVHAVQCKRLCVATSQVATCQQGPSCQ